MTTAVLKRTEFLTADEAFDQAEARSRDGYDIDVLVCRIEGKPIGYRIAAAAVFPPVGWEPVARLFGIGTPVGPELMKMIGGTA